MSMVEPPDAFSRYDGEVLLVVDSDGQTPTLSRPWAAAKPIVAAVPDDVSALDAAAREIAAVRAALDDPSVAEDWVARRELGERLAQTQVAFDQALVDTFSADSCQWLLLGAHGSRDLPGGRGSAALSDAADLTYHGHSEGPKRDAQSDRTHVAGSKSSRTSSRGHDRAWGRTRSWHGRLRA